MECISPTYATLVGRKEDGTCVLSFRLSAKGDKMALPCGKCSACIRNRQKEWVDRCLCESMFHDTSYFVTLTYNDGHVPTIIDSNGQMHYTLRKKDWQNFMKRLRKTTGQKLRYFMCGEYGPRTIRPHYHAIIFGLSLPDMVLQGGTPGKPVYGSKYLEKIWSNGFVQVEAVNQNTIAYVAGYVQKKLVKKSLPYDDFGIEREFNLMSRRPGIGMQLYEEMPSLCYTGHYPMTTEDGMRDIVPPRLWYKHFKVDFPDLAEEVREKKLEKLEIISENVLTNHDGDWYDYLKTRRAAAKSDWYCSRNKI